MKPIRIHSWEDANRTALTQALVTVVFCILYTYIIMGFTGGDEFVGKQPTQVVVNGIRHDVVLVICGILAGFIPIILLRYTKAKFLIMYLPMNVIYYFILMFLVVAFIIDDNFDLIVNALLPVPTGSFVGMVIAIIMNCFINKKYDVSEGGF